MRDFTADLSALGQRLADAEGYLDLEGKRKRTSELEAVLAKPDLWDDTDHARKVTTELSNVKEDVDLVDAQIRMRVGNAPLQLGEVVGEVAHDR